MTRIAVIGNSHIAALKYAWTEMSAVHPGLDITFFGAPQTEMVKMRLDRRLCLAIPSKRRDADSEALLQRINGRSSISLRQFDIVLRVGVTSPWFLFPRVIEKRDIDDLRETGARERLSRSAFEAIATAMGMAAVPGEPWRGWTRPKLYVMPVPAIAESCLSSQRKIFRPHAEMAAHPDGLRAIHDLLFDAMEASLAETRISLIRQPAETLTEAALTQARFRSGARRLRDGQAQDEDEHRHMNSTYGGLCMDALLDRIAEADTSTPTARTGR
ncbi:MAG: hypothetical protein AAGF44_04280, partial [Pseudomonadota bacterium]